MYLISLPIPILLQIRSCPLISRHGVMGYDNMWRYARIPTFQRTLLSLLRWRKRSLPKLCYSNASLYVVNTCKTTRRTFVATKIYSYALSFSVIYLYFSGNIFISNRFIALCNVWNALCQSFS